MSFQVIAIIVGVCVALALWAVIATKKAAKYRKESKAKDGVIEAVKDNVDKLVKSADEAGDDREKIQKLDVEISEAKNVKETRALRVHMLGDINSILQDVSAIRSGKTPPGP